MLNFFKQLFRRHKRDLQVILLGLDEAGKSTLLKRMKLNEYVFVTTTMGFNQEFVEFDNLKLRVLDLGGQEAFRGTLWPSLINEGADIIIFIIDAHNKKRAGESKLELRNLFKNEKVKSASIGILANKQDIEGALSAGELMNYLELTNLTSERSVSLFPTSMMTGEGLDELYDWIKIEAQRHLQPKPRLAKSLQ